MKVAREAAMRTIDRYLHKRLTEELAQFNGLDVLIDATESRLLPKRKYRNGAQLFTAYKKTMRLYRQRYGELPASKADQQGFPYFYGIVLEYGSPNHTPRAPYRKSANRVRGATKKVFSEELRKELYLAETQRNYGKSDGDK